MRKMVLSALALFVYLGLPGKTVAQMQVEEGGEGPYKAIIAQDDLLPGFIVTRPADLQAAKEAEGGPLPVILFGNGSCSRDSWLFLKYLTHLASHGYVILSMSPLTPDGPDLTQYFGKAESATGVPPELSERMQKYASPDGGRDAMDILAALDLLEGLSKSSWSEYYGRLDTSRVTAMGQSCGGLQALLMSSQGDPRIKTTVALNTGIFPTQAGQRPYVTGKDALSHLPGPIIYIIGGETDIAYPQAVSDFELISQVPVVRADLPVGHAGTFIYPHGGEFADVALLWLDGQIKGRKVNMDYFKDGKLPDGLSPEWELTSKNL